MLYIKKCNTVSGIHPDRIRILYTTNIGGTATPHTSFQVSSLNILKILCSNLLIGYPLHNHKCYKSSCVRNSLLSNSIFTNNCVCLQQCKSALLLYFKTCVLSELPLTSVFQFLFERTSAHSMLIRFSSV